MTVGELLERMTYEELLLWDAYYSLLSDEQRQLQNKMNATRRRR